METAICQGFRFHRSKNAPQGPPAQNLHCTVQSSLRAPRLRPRHPCNSPPRTRSRPPGRRAKTRSRSPRAASVRRRTQTIPPRPWRGPTIHLQGRMMRAPHPPRFRPKHTIGPKTRNYWGIQTRRGRPPATASRPATPRGVRRLEWRSPRAYRMEMSTHCLRFRATCPRGLLGRDTGCRPQSTGLAQALGRCT